MSEVIRKSVALLTTIVPTEDKEEWSATEVSRHLDIPIQTVHRLLSSLAEYGFVFKNNETKKFRLGLTLMQLGLSIRDNLSVRNSALPIMEKLVKKTGESVYLTVPEGTEGVLVDCLNKDLLSKETDVIGMRTPLCVGASNKAILSHLSRDTKQHIIQTLIEQGEISDVSKLENELKLIAKWKIASSVGETIKGTGSIAAPIFSWEGKVVASISIVCSETNFTDHQAKYMMSEVKKAAGVISEELGWLKSS
ncbi:IclR family transcriptional regulator [Bacillus sp. 37MA]|uniref:IclR family transcriptional regulator n=1 Tax=Bacillus sp. 37MA TaxID=1132442 RepID=UPI00035F8B14|nr:IclR family transcriptional regulator [Bacillus sp. 37MA]